MSYDVIHGTGTPRIITGSAKVAEAEITTVSSVTQLSFESLIGSTVSFVLTNNLGRLAVTKDENGDTIYARVTSWLGAYFTMGFSAWSGGDPASGNEPVLGNIVEFYGFVLDLPYCESLVESFSLEGYDKKFDNGDIEPIKKGWYYAAILDYSNYVKKETLQQIGKLIDISEKKFLFYPRSDNPSVSYVVDFPMEFRIEFAQHRFHQDHKLVLLELRGLKRLAKPDFDSEPADNQYGYGEYFGYFH